MRKINSFQEFLNIISLWCFENLKFQGLPSYSISKRKTPKGYNIIVPWHEILWHSGRISFVDEKYYYIVRLEGDSWKPLEIEVSKRAYNKAFKNIYILFELEKIKEDIYIPLSTVAFVKEV